MTLDQALFGSSAPPEILAEQTLIEVPILPRRGKTQRGQMVLARDLALEVEAIFWEIYDDKFPIESMVPVVAFDWSDEASMLANNSSAFNYRNKVGNSALSLHAMGRAVDINPCLNPYIKGDVVLPPGAHYRPEMPGTLLPDDIVVRAFESRGWQWGGRWSELCDYHHFEKS